MNKIYYISKSEGNDNNDGLSPSTPLKSLKKIEWSSRTGDNVDNIYLFKAGDTWEDETGIVNYLRGSKDNKKRIKYSKYGKGKLPILPQLNLTSNIIISDLFFKHCKGTHLNHAPLEVYQRENIEIKDCVFDGDYSGEKVFAGLYINNCNNVIISNNKISNYLSNGIGLNVFNSYNIIIENNYIKGWEEGINIYQPSENKDTYNIIVRNNDTISTKKGGGSAIEVSWGGCYNILIYNNRCRSNNYGLMLEGRNIYAYNNLLIDDEKYTFTDAIRFGGMKAEWQKYNTDNYFSDMKIYDNIIITKGRFFRIDGYGNLTNIKKKSFVFNNIFYSKNKDINVHIQQYDAIKNSFNFRNNYFYTDNSKVKVRRNTGNDILSWSEFAEKCGLNSSNIYSYPFFSKKNTDILNISYINLRLAQNNLQEIKI